MLVPGRVYCIVQENYTASNSSKWGYDTPNTFIFPLRFSRFRFENYIIFFPMQRYFHLQRGKAEKIFLEEGILRK